MSKRLQVILDDKEFIEIQKVAKRAGMPLSQWVRLSLRNAKQQVPSKQREEKLRALKRAAMHEGPVSDIAQMNREIMAGYLKQSI